METPEYTVEQKRKIRDYFLDPTYPQPHGEVIATQLLAAMIASGKYECEEYSMLVDKAVELTHILVVLFDAEVLRDIREKAEEEVTAPPKLTGQDSGVNSGQDFDPIPF